jgi:membrane protein required for colicin V production
MAFVRGLIREVFSIVAFFAALIAALVGFSHVAPSLSGVFGNALIAAIGSGVLIFLVVYFGITILTGIIAKAAHSSGEIGALDRGGGLIYGFARGFLIMAVAVVMVRSVTGQPEQSPQAQQPTWLTKSISYPYLANAAMALEALAPQVNQAIKDRHAQGKSIIPGVEKPIQLPGGVIASDATPPPEEPAPPKAGEPQKSPPAAPQK